MFPHQPPCPVPRQCDEQQQHERAHRRICRPLDIVPHRLIAVDPVREKLMQAPVVEQARIPHQAHQAIPPSLFGQHIHRLALRIRSRFHLARECKPLLPLRRHAVDQAVLRLRLREQPVHPGLRVHRQIEPLDERPAPRVLHGKRKKEKHDRAEECRERPHRMAARPALVNLPSPVAHHCTLLCGFRRHRLAASSFRARSVLPASARS